MRRVTSGLVCGRGVAISCTMWLDSCKISDTLAMGEQGGYENRRDMDVCWGTPSNCFTASCGIGKKTAA